MNANLGFNDVPNTLMIKAVRANGAVIFIEATTAYNTYNLTLTNLFSKKDCEIVINSMNFYGIVACQDAVNILSGRDPLKEDFFTINDVLRIHRLLPN